MGGVMALKRLSARLVFAASLSFLVVALPAARSQDRKDHPVADAQQLAKQCNPVLVKKSKLKPKAIRVREGEKSTGYTPIIAFQIASTGKVLNAHVKRSSGIRDMDDSALSSIQSGKYNSRPGCPVIDSEADVLIDLR
jgi:TonB family protein